MRPSCPGLPVPRSLVLAIVAASALLLPTESGASVIADPDDAKLADKCHKAIHKAGTKFIDKKLASLEKCVDAIFKCVQTKPGDQKCLDKAKARCAKELGTKVAKERAKIESVVGKKCDALPDSDFLSGDGIGYDGVAAECLADYGTTVDGAPPAAECVHRQHECLAERMFDIQMPRAYGLLDQQSVALRAESCLDDLGGAGDVGDPKGLGKALEKCQKTIKKAGRKFVAKKLKLLQKCVAAVFTCIQRKPGDAKCLAKAEARCDKTVDTSIPKEEAKLEQAISKRCAAIYASAGAGNAMNIDGLAKRCVPFGGGALATQADYNACITLQHECLVEELLRFQAPRANDLLQRVGRGLPLSGCPTPTPTVTPTPTPTLTANPGEFLLSVTKTGTGTGTVSTTDANVDCGSDCGHSYSPATVVTLEARTQNGDASYFQHWSGDGCEGSFRDCTVTMDQSRSVQAHFAPQTHNLVFLSSANTRPDLGNVAAIDAFCNTLATAAGINNLAGDAFISWTSETGSTAPTRLGAAEGFVRLDGKQFSSTVSALVNGNEVRNALNVDEQGMFYDDRIDVMTGTVGNGAVSSNCNDWTSIVVTDLVRTGSSVGGPVSWTQGPLRGCDSARRVYCFMNTKTQPLPQPTPAGKLIYVSNVGVSTGYDVPDDPDLECEGDKPAGAGTVKALLARTTEAASAHLDAGTTYVRPDGQVVGTGAEIIATGDKTNGVLLPSGIWQFGNGFYTEFGSNAWTGHGTLTEVGTVAETCNDWTDTAGTGQTGILKTTDDNWWDGSDIDQPCDAPKALYCVEQ